MFGFAEALFAQISLLPKSPIKSIQRGVTAGAGSVTINPVDVNKTVVLSKSKGSAGYVAARGSGSITFNLYRAGYKPDGVGNSEGANRDQTASFSLSGGSTDLTTKQYSATLIDSTTLNCDGPVEWQVIEFV